MPPRQRAAAVKHYRKCGCGCDASVRTAAAWYIPGHAPEKIPIEDASGQWVKLTNISTEPAAFARIGKVDVSPDNLFVTITVMDHPTCGGFTWTYPKGTEVQVKPTWKR